MHRLLILLLSTMLLAGCCEQLTNHYAFHPGRQCPERFPDGLPGGVEAGFIQARDGTKLRVFFVRGDDAGNAVLVLHGNGGRTAGRIASLALPLAELGPSVLLLGYRGYGCSEGSPDERGVYMDAEAGLAELARRGFAEENVTVFGRSLGTAVAIDLARGRALKGLVLVSAFTSGADVARDWFLGLGRFLGVACRPFDSLGKVAEVAVPALFVHGGEDRLTPPALGRRLFEAYPGRKRFELVEGAGHGNVMGVAGGDFWGWVGEVLGGGATTSASFQ